MANLGSISRYDGNIFLFGGLHLLLHYPLQTFPFICPQSQWSLSCVPMSRSNTVWLTLLQFEQHRDQAEEINSVKDFDLTYTCSAVYYIPSVYIYKTPFMHNFRSFIFSILLLLNFFWIVIHAVYYTNFLFNDFSEYIYEKHLLTRRALKELRPPPRPTVHSSVICKSASTTAIYAWMYFQNY